MIEHNAKSKKSKKYFREAIILNEYFPSQKLLKFCLIWRDQHSGLRLCIQDWKVSVSNTTQLNLSTRLMETLGSNLQQMSDQHRVRETASLSVAETWPWGTQINRKRA